MNIYTYPPVLVVGAGLVGLVTALTLLQDGISVRIIDKGPNPRIGQRGAGISPRSIQPPRGRSPVVWHSKLLRRNPVNERWSNENARKSPCGIRCMYWTIHALPAIRASIDILSSTGPASRRHAFQGRFYGVTQTTLRTSLPTLLHHVSPFPLLCHSQNSQ
ncbi:hypothetical protein DFH29DRAFT_875154 [Suillus ampliporus]|nr:hypothetical protein DFH29DRAFT_875154 [Suillus ampliporus]